MSIMSRYYNQRAVSYGISRTRKRKILELFGSRHNKRVLDLGCATGYLGAFFKKKGNYVIGADISNKAVKVAKKKLDQAFAFDLESQRWPREIVSQRFDVVIAAEILEHFFDPEAFLLKIRKLLKNNGFLIITTPNFLFWLNRFKILFGRFEYKDEGMFDQGHVHFFTYQSLKERLVKTGFKIVQENHLIIPGFLETILKYFPSLFTCQFVLKAQIKP